uniref:Uncharacterized protein n=1 Tax=Candidatus Kentrum sp. FM TaxID=2126340 RepID=A0A450TH30_9GAMM|nr:MAG: hypothetical protein BECKFM1743C_GA0114222_104274 [Candidatus Kentron sp. FM]VFJ68361.1 MAG: hypothetical protein BECKFM1743A_GA0114220_104715 [Candidatus Kentron sp. FM]VFK17214.1 MAG: hypothetical protein BECKFM1743B_GA0114221_104674 [Candidatus Kentron sp. FM]
MKAYAYEHTVKKNGMLTLKNLPFNIGEKIEVIIIPRPKSNSKEKRYPFWRKPITYPNPTAPVAEADWEIYQ